MTYLKTDLIYYLGKPPFCIHPTAKNCPFWFCFFFFSPKEYFSLRNEPHNPEYTGRGSLPEWNYSLNLFILLTENFECVVH